MREATARKCTCFLISRSARGTCGSVTGISNSRQGGTFLALYPNDAQVAWLEPGVGRLLSLRADRPFGLPVASHKRHLSEKPLRRKPAGDPTRSSREADFQVPISVNGVSRDI